MVWGTFLGMALGVVIGSATRNLGLWLPLGLMGGMLVGVVASRRRRTEAPREGEPPHRD